MQRKPQTKLLVILSIAAFLMLLFFGGRYFIYSKIKGAIVSKIADLKKEGFDIRYDSLAASSWTNEISLSNLFVKFPKSDGPCSDSVTTISLAKASISGLEIIPLIFRHKISLKTISLKRPHINYRKDTKGNAMSSSAPSKQKIAMISVSHIELDSAHVEILDSATCTIVQNAKFNFLSDNIVLNEPGTSNTNISIGYALLTSLRLKLPQNLYTLSLQKLEWQETNQLLRVDSIRLIPYYDKAMFAKKAGIQTDRVSASIPLIAVSGISSITDIKDGLHARHADLNFDVSVFRDKRYPFLVKKNKNLPMRSLRNLGIKILIDTVLISKSNVEYEEFPEEGEKAGIVTFNDLRARIYNVSNYFGDKTTMNATTKFMNTGDLHAEFTFPRDPDKPATVVGTVINFNMKELNRILIPAANAEVKSGMLEALKFNFQYNDYRSDGALTMHYTDLDIASLTKSKEHKTNKFLTLILQAFIVKKDMDKNKSQGTILFYRDPQRAIFNYWWKSILSGVKSVYNLDKILDTHHTKKK